MRNRILAILATIAVATVLGTTSARADQITLGDSCSTDTLSTSLPITGSATGCQASWEQGANPLVAIGTYALTNDGTSFALTGTGSYSTWVLDGTVNWTTDYNGTTCFSAICGDITVTSVSGFNNEYVQGGTYSIDLAFTGGGRVSSGEIPVPEPSMLTLLGTGLLTMAGFLRRKLSA